MPPTTRFKAAKTSSFTSAPKESTRESLTARARKAKKLPHLANTSKKSTQQLPVPRSQKAKKPSPAASALSEKSTRILPSNAIVHWPCQSCSCLQGVFAPPIDVCIFCEHNMDEHELPYSDAAWDPFCNYVCQREGLVAATLRLVLEKGVVVIRATPQVGKTTLLLLLGRHIRDECPSLEPIWLQWRPLEKRNGLPYQNYLDHEAMH